MQPIREFGVDALILFADIMVPLTYMGIDLEIIDAIGPVIHTKIEGKEDVEKISKLHAESLTYIVDTIQTIKKELDPAKAIVGFGGAPFTLASYLIEGKPTRDFIKTKRFMYEKPVEWHTLMTKLTDATILYLSEQIKAGADAFQLFDSWVGFLTPADYRAYVLPHTKRIFASFANTKIPRIHFGTNTTAFLADFASVDCTVVSLDWRTAICDAQKVIPADKAIQGNFDPTILLSTQKVIESKVDALLSEVSNKHAYIFNLGHGILPNTPLENIKHLTHYVQSK
jgi:uroporphyrinogen decarboxylase